MLDDLQVMYYDSITRQAVHRSYNDSTHYDEEKSDAGVIFRDMYNDMKTRAFYLKEHLNHTDGVHVHQRLAGCELLSDDKPGPLQTWDAFDQQNKEEFIFNEEKNNFQIELPWIMWDHLQFLHIKFLYKNVYHPVCIKALQSYLQTKKNNVMRKVKPRVRLIRKTLPDSQGLQIICLATGFYPRHINLTLFRDCQPVDDDQITGGEILPNGDGTYQMRKSLVISEEELREGHKYNCTIKHLSLDNKLDITFVSDVAESDPGSFSQSKVFSVLLFMCVTGLIIAALITWRKRRAPGSHSLMAFVTYIGGETPFPEFSVVVMLDDVQIGYYDSVTWTVLHRSLSESKYDDEERTDAVHVFREMYNSMKDRADYLKAHLNHTDGIHVQQRLAGCELLDNGKPGLFYFWDAFSGLNMEEFTFDMEKNNIQMKMPWMVTWDQVKRLKVQFMYENVYHPICIKVLQRYLNMEKNSVMRKVKPRVRLMRKMLPDSQELQISCLATGFYPRHINLTLFRDGHPVDDDQITGGEILPNGDGTYQMRKSLVISEEDLRKGHKYNCTMKHLNLDNKLDITFDVAEYEPGSFNLSVVVSVLVIMCVAVLIITYFIIWMKKRAAASVEEET
ncbi:hypothetical protein QQF64_031930 [Cirrhinus molitorella]|uniref:Ig-like domain-containing protein n=1 Tax=Cirrhinus molitorella TaxID=172907 RepID=A0ABR3MYJ2_9TELE